MSIDLDNLEPYNNKLLDFLVYDLWKEVTDYQMKVKISKMISDLSTQKLNLFNLILESEHANRDE